MRMTWSAVALTEDELAGICRATSPFAELDRVPRERRSGLDEDWHLAHWLLTGRAAPVEGSEGFIRSGGREVPRLEATHGPARYFAPAGVSAIRDVLRRRGREVLIGRWDPDAIQRDGVYPFSTRLEDEDLWFALEHLDELRALLEGLDPGAGLLVLLD